MKNFSWIEKAKGAVTVTTTNGDGISPLMSALVAVMAELITQPPRGLWAAVGWIDWPLKARADWPTNKEIDNFFCDIFTVSRVYHGFTEDGVMHSMKVEDGLATMTWWGKWTPGRTVSLEIKPGSATLSWDTGTDEKSSFITGTVCSFLKDIEEEIE